MDHLNLRQIAVPGWAPRHARHVVDLDGADPEAAREAFSQYREQILEELHRRLEQFVNDPELCSSDPRVASPGSEVEPFPLRGRLAGTYYIGSETYCDCTDRSDRPSYDLVVFFRLQEVPWAPGQVDCDYLGLEARAYLWLPQRQLELDEGFASSVI